MCQFFLPLATEMQNKQIRMTFAHKIVVFQPVISSCCVDLPAKAAVQCIKQCNGYNSCTFCRHPGCQTTNRKGTSFARFPMEKDINMELRTHEQTLISMQKRIKAPGATEKEDGIKNYSCLVGFDYVDIIYTFGIDYMHNCLLGIGVLLFELWTNSGHKALNHYIVPKKRTILNERIESLKLCSFIHRKPRSFEYKNKYKANEIRSLILYCLPICLREILPHEYYTHFMLFSNALHILLRVKLTEFDLEMAEKKLVLFVHQFEKLYGKHNMVMNVHMLLHLVDSVRRHGPLWMQSAFPFEDYNGVLSRYVVGPREVLLQITTKYLLSKSLSNKGKPIARCFDHPLGKSSPIRITIVGEMLALEKIGIQHNTIMAFKRYKSQNSIVYTSELYKKAKRTVDYFVKLKNDQIGKIKYFFESGGENVCMLKCFNFTSEVEHLTEIKETDQFKVITIDFIQSKLIHIKMYDQNYVTFEPNPFERE